VSVKLGDAGAVRLPALRPTVATAFAATTPAWFERRAAGPWRRINERVWRPQRSRQAGYLGPSRAGVRPRRESGARDPCAVSGDRRVAQTDAIERSRLAHDRGEPR
jgi:hypothetical protein